jgi:flagellar hook protein FlgE
MAWDDPANVITPATPPDTSTFNMSKASVVYDTLGGQHTLTQYFQAAAPSAGAVNVNVHYLVDGVEVQPSATGPRQMSFDATTGQLLVPDPAVDSNKFTLTGIPAAANGAIIKDIVIDYTGTTSFAGEATTSTNNVDGYASGTYSGVDLAADGSIVAKYSNGQKQAVGKIGIATFADEGALTSVSDTSWEASAGSGTALVSTAGTGMGGTLNTSSLEQSNVDITSELVGLMTSQRNYQANSKVIQTESTMLQSLMQAI